MLAQNTVEVRGLRDEEELGSSSEEVGNSYSREWRLRHLGR